MTDTIGLARPVLLVALAAVAASAVAAPAVTPGPLTVYVGTYTDGTSRGIYRLTFDPATGAMTEPVLAVETKNPSFLALHPNGRFLYAAGEVSSFEGAKTGMVSAFAIDPKTGDLTLLNQRPSAGAGPCHLVVDKTGRNVLVANYGGGTVAVLPIEADGRLKPASSVRAHEGSGPNTGRQEKPHAHGIYLDATEQFALSPDLGADRVFVYRFDAAKGTLEPHGAAPLAPGSGPRHLAFHPSGKFLYVINELLSTVTVLLLRRREGRARARSRRPPPSPRASRARAGRPRSPSRPTAVSSTGPTAATTASPCSPSTRRPVASRPPATLRSEGRTRATSRSTRPAASSSSPTRAPAPSPSLRIDPATGLPTLVGSPVKVDKPVCLLPAPKR